MTIHVISHADCYDGVASAYVMWRSFGKRQPQYHFMNYQTELPDGIGGGDIVYVVDFSLSKEQVVDLARRGVYSLIVTDHHESAVTNYLSHRVDMYKEGVLKKEDIESGVFTLGLGTVIDSNRNSVFFEESDFAEIEDEQAKLEAIEDWIDAHGINFVRGDGHIAAGSEKMDYHFRANLEVCGCINAVEFTSSVELVSNPFLGYVNDRDMWQWKLPNSQEVSEGLGQVLLKEYRTQRYEQALKEIAKTKVFEYSDPNYPIYLGQLNDPGLILSGGIRTICEELLKYDYIKSRYLTSQEEILAELEFIHGLATDPDYVQKMSVIGQPLVSVRTAEAQELASHATLIDFLGYQVPFAHAPKHHSWVAHEMLNQYKDCKFAVVWRERDGIIKLDLRSRSPGECRVNRIARQVGGGGHPCASGARYTSELVERLHLPIPIN